MPRDQTNGTTASILDNVVQQANTIIGLEETTEIVDRLIDENVSDNGIIDELIQRMDVTSNRISDTSEFISFGDETIDYTTFNLESATTEIRTPSNMGFRTETLRTTRRNHNGARTVVEDGFRIPRIEEQIESKKSYPMKKINKQEEDEEKIKHIYPEDGWMHPYGSLFSRKLTYKEDQYFKNYGAKEAIKKFPDILFKEKEKPIDEKEEVIVTICEIADYYATEECKNSIVGFDIKIHNEDYQKAYKKHIKAINSFKRNKNG